MNTQVLFSRYCPLFDSGLTIGMRLLYTSVTWCYITNTLAVPTAVLVPFIALVFGVYPLVLNRDFALAATLYFSASTLVTSYCTNRKHIKPLWFCIVSCHLLWFTFTKAQFNVLFKMVSVCACVCLGGECPTHRWCLRSALAHSFWPRPWPPWLRAGSLALPTCPPGQQTR